MCLFLFCFFIPVIEMAVVIQPTTFRHRRLGTGTITYLNYLAPRLLGARAKTFLGKLKCEIFCRGMQQVLFCWLAFDVDFGYFILQLQI